MKQSETLPEIESTPMSLSNQEVAVKTEMTYRSWETNANLKSAFLVNLSVLGLAWIKIKHNHSHKKMHLIRTKLSRKTFKVSTCSVGCGLKLWIRNRKSLKGKERILLRRGDLLGAVRAEKRVENNLWKKTCYILIRMIQTICLLTYTETIIYFP